MQTIFVYFLYVYTIQGGGGSNQIAFVNIRPTDQDDCLALSNRSFLLFIMLMLLHPQISFLPTPIQCGKIICDTFKLNMGVDEKSCYIGLSFVFTIS